MNNPLTRSWYFAKAVQTITSVSCHSREQVCRLYRDFIISVRRDAFKYNKSVDLTHLIREVLQVCTLIDTNIGVDKKRGTSECIKWRSVIQTAAAKMAQCPFTQFQHKHKLISEITVCLINSQSLILRRKITDSVLNYSPLFCTSCNFNCCITVIHFSFVNILYCVNCVKPFNVNILEQ